LSLLSRKEIIEMKRIVVVGVAIAIVLLVGISWAKDADKEKAAVTAAQKWLTLIDAGKYSESWQESSEYFRNAVNQDQWEQMLQSVRNPLGKVISRKLKTKAYKTSLPGAPDGQYVVIQFDTSFQNKKSAIETVTPVFDKDGQWRMSGYYIK
jgi:hypothetical protein